MYVVLDWSRPQTLPPEEVPVLQTSSLRVAQTPFLPPASILYCAIEEKVWLRETSKQAVRHKSEAATEAKRSCESSRLLCQTIL